jgi:hypothetical protein
MDPMTALASLIIGIYKEKKIQSWLTFLFQLSFSATASFLFVCGTTLISSKSWTLSIGSGMVVSSVTLVVFFRKSSLTRGMMAVLPEEEATKELTTDIQIIEKK